MLSVLVGWPAGSALLGGALAALAALALGWWRQLPLTPDLFVGPAGFGALLGYELGLLAGYLRSLRDEPPSWDVAARDHIGGALVVILIGCAIYWAITWL